MDTIRIFLPYLERDAVAFHVACQSVIRNCTRPVAITPLVVGQVGLLGGPSSPGGPQASDRLRFLVPYLCDYTGWALFLGYGSLLLRDVAEVWDLRNPRCAVQVAKPAQRPLDTHGVILFNNPLCRNLSPDYVRTAEDRDLHQLRWLSPDRIGVIPAGWDHRVDADPPLPNRAIAALHFVGNGPWSDDCPTASYGETWWNEMRHALAPLNGPVATPNSRPVKKTA